MSMVCRHDRGKGQRGRSPAHRVHAETLTWDIASRFCEVQRVIRKVMSKVRRQGYTGQNAFAVKLGLEESLINAIKHGNRMDVAKHVHIEATISPAKVRLVIEDEGRGFDRRRVPDPRLEENLTKCSGRGILLMEAYMDTVKFRRGGRRIEMIRNNHKTRE